MGAVEDGVVVVGHAVLADVPVDTADDVQVWSLSPFKVSRQILNNDFKNVPFLSLHKTSKMALAN